MTKSHEELIQRANDEVIGKGNSDAIDEFFTPDYVVHAGGKDYQGHDSIRRFTGQLRSAIPDIRVKDVAVLMQTDETIAWQRTFTGTHKVEMMGIPPSGQRVEWRDIVISRFEAGKIAEEWTVSELAAELLLKVPGKNS